MVSAPDPALRWRGGSGRVDKAMANRRNCKGSVAPSSSRGKEKEVGQFLLSKTMGEGTFGEVKLAIHKPTSERVAAKVLEKNRIKTIADVKRVSREIKILKRVRHPNVIALYEVLDTPSTIFFLMEHCDGGELFDYIVRHQRLQEGQACFFFRQLVDGIEYLHNHDVTHRDLKPENLLLQSSKDGWRLKIIDFGLSNTHEDGRLLKTACGSPCYAAPEMIAGKSYRGPGADVWSSGVVLFTLIAGFLPFEDPNTSSLYKKILSGTYEIPRWLSQGAVTLLSKILNTDPAKRADIDEIRADAWYREAHPPPTKQAVTPYPAVPSCHSDLDEKLLARAVLLAGGGSQRPRGNSAEDTVSITAIKEAVEGLLSGRHDPVSTTYHLLLKRSLREKKSKVGAETPVPSAASTSVDGHGNSGNNARKSSSEVVVVGNIAGTENANGEGGRGRSTVRAVVVGGRNMGEHGVAAATAAAAAAGTAATTVYTAVAAAAVTAAAAATAAVAAAAAATRIEPPTVVLETAHAPRTNHSNDSHTSSTSNSRSEQQRTARRRSPRFMASTQRDMSRRISDAEAMRAPEKPAGTTAERADFSNGRALESPSKFGPSELRPKSAAPRAEKSSTPMAADVCQGAEEPGTIVENGVARESFGGKPGKQRGGDERFEGGGKTRHRPVPALSLRGIARTGTADLRGGDGSGGSGRLASSAVFVSQTARSGDGNLVGRAATTSLENQRRRSRTHSHRDSGGSTSSRGGGVSGSGHIKTSGAATGPRRPLTARAPLRSSAPTPRLSGDFNLARPRGAPASAGGRSRAISISSSQVARKVSGNIHPISGVPLGMAPTSVVSTSTTTTTTARSATVAREIGGVASVPTRPTSHEPSLRVRLSTLSAKSPRQWRNSGRGEEGKERALNVAGAPGASGASGAAVVSSVARRSFDSSRPLPHRPPFSSTNQGAVVADTAVACARDVAASSRSSWGKIPPTVRAPHAFAKNWARSAPIALPQTRPSNSAAGIEAATTAPEKDRAKGGG